MVLWEKKISGIIFIFYVSDVEDGQFQYIKGSHIWSQENACNNFSDDFIEKNYKDKILIYLFLFFITLSFISLVGSKSDQVQGRYAVVPGFL